MSEIHAFLRLICSLTIQHFVVRYTVISTKQQYETTALTEDSDSSSLYLHVGLGYSLNTLQ